MLDLSIQQLADALGGSLRMSQAPPKGGVWEPIFRVVLSCYEARRGDLFWQLDAPTSLAPHAADTSATQEAFARGAIGCVTSKHQALPWAGAFSLEVDDPVAALVELAWQLRDRYRGKIVMVMGERSAETTQLVYDVIASSWNASLCLASSSRPELPLEILQLETLDDFAVIELIPEKNASFLRLCRPAVVVITPPTSSDELRRARETIATLDASQLVVLVGSCDALLDDLSTARCQMVWFACDQRASVRNSFSRDRTLPLTAAIAVGQLLEVSIAEIADALDAPLRSLTPMPISRAA